MKTLPENIVKLNDAGELVQNGTSEIVSRVVAKFKIERVEEEFIKKSAEEVVQDFFLVAFNAADGTTPTVPQGYEKYETAFTKIVAIVEAHKKAEATVKEKKNLEDAAKKKQKEEAAKAKEEEDKFFVNQDNAFQGTLISTLSKTKDTATSAISVLQKSVKLPKSISFAKEGQGLVFAEGVTVEDIAAATSGVIAGLEGQAAAEGLLQFAMGDIINKAVETKAYRSKGDAQSAIALVVNEKAKRSYVAGSLAQYATMAARIPLEARKPGVSPSLYLQASKAVVPRDKNIKGDELTKLENSFEEGRAKLVEQINNGTLGSVKAVQEATKKIVENLGVEKKDSPGELKKNREAAMRDFFFWVFIKNDILNKHKEGYAVLKLSDGNNIEVPASEISQNLSAAYAKARELNVSDLEAVIAGKKSVKGKGDKVTEDKFYMPYPFEVKKEEKKEEPAAAEVQQSSEEQAQEAAQEQPETQDVPTDETPADDDIDI